MRFVADFRVCSISEIGLLLVVYSQYATASVEFDIMQYHHDYGQVKTRFFPVDGHKTIVDIH